MVIRTGSWGFLGLGEYSVMVSLGEEFPHVLPTKTSNQITSEHQKKKMDPWDAVAETLPQQTWLLLLCWYLVLEWLQMCRRATNQLVVQIHFKL